MAKQIKRFSKIALIVSLMISLVVIYFVTPTAQAGILSSREVRLSDTRLGQTNVQYDFLATGQASDIKCIKLSFCDETAIGGSCTAPDSMDTTGATTTNPSAWNNLDPTYWIIGDEATTSNTIMASTTQAGEQLGSAGSFVIGGITNANVTSSYFVWIQTYSDSGCTTAVDEGVVGYALYSGITVTATISETLTVTVNASTCDGFINSGTAKASTTTTIPYGTINTQTFYDSCQRLDISTNGLSGYVARIHKTGELTTAADNAWISDGTCDGSCSTTTEATWSSTSNGGFGYCMKDRTSNAAQTADNGWGSVFCGAGSQSFKVISNTSAAAASIMQSNSATSSNESWIGYRLNAPADQAAGSYSTVIVYTVTPRY